MEKELRFLWVYLPYDLMVYYTWDGEDNYVKMIPETLTILQRKPKLMDNFKPILRPISDLTGKECIRMFEEVHGSRDDISCNDDKKKRTVHWSNDNGFGGNVSKGFMRVLDKMGRLERMLKEEWDWLYKNHYDVNGWIKKDLALDINSIDIDKINTQ